VLALSAGANLNLLVEQIKTFKPKYAFLKDQADRQTLKTLFPNLEVLDSLLEISALKVDLFVSAIVGIAGLESNLRALENARRVCIANKETLVVAGHLVKRAQAKTKAELIPIDSEHVAIHQCLHGYDSKDVKQILLTSSGGPFRNKSLIDLNKVTLADALKHPTWQMGAKITIDSSTLMNKALEVIEAHVLFEIPYEKIQIVIHPQSIVHSAVTYYDGNTLAQLGSANMEVPIQYALDYPNKVKLATEDTFNIFEHPKLEFMLPDEVKFNALKLLKGVCQAKHSFYTVFNAANEAAVALFLAKKISYLEITRIIEACLEQHQIIKEPELAEVLEIDNNIKTYVEANYKNL
jgi:1-deoxy-D-xylulose-5-phosphate reductoisomerase